jgi:transcription-repair coupling factor (superfamily II helicase)
MKSPVKSPATLLAPGRALTFANVAEGAEGLVVSDLARAVAARPKPPAVSLAVVCRDGPRMQQLARALEFFAPDLPVMQFPAWDCQPYDRVSPHGGILAQRLTTLARLSRLQGSDKPLIVLTTVNAIVQRVPAREVVAAQALSVAPGHVVPMDSIVAWLEHNGYNRSSTVREPGEYAVRGGILDLFPAGLDQPVRFDFFGDSLESIRTFDAETQRTLLDMRALDLVPVSEFQLVTETIRRFRMGYVATFGAPPPSRHGALAAAVPGADGYAVRLSRRRAGRDRAAERGCCARTLQADPGLLRGKARGAGTSRLRCDLQAVAAGPALYHGNRVDDTAQRGRAGPADAICGA